MHWLSSPKARLALLVNGLYLFTLFAPPLHWWRARVFPHASEGRRRANVYAPLPPAPGPPKATTYRGSGTSQLEVYLTTDLTLVKRPGHTLLLSPIYTADADGSEPPADILLRFISFSDNQVFADDSPLVIAADGKVLWPEYPYGRATLPDPRSRHSATDGGDGRIIETVGDTLPYDLFVEIVSAHSVVIRLGPDAVELSPEQIEALRDLHRKLPRPDSRATSGGR